MTLNDEIKKLILQRETEFLEFKSSARWDYKQSKKNKDLELVILKTVSALMNSKGGTLLIGIDDDGNVIGLVPDYNTLQKKNADGFEVFLHTLFSDNFGSDACQFIDIKICLIEEHEVCKITVPASVKPIYLDNDLYIRTGASSRKLNTKEAIDYHLVRWQNFASEEQNTSENYNKEIKQAEEKISNRLDKKLDNYGYWMIYSYPVKYLEKRIAQPGDIKKIVDEVMVKNREPFFPDIRESYNENKFGNFNKGFRFFDIEDDNIEVSYFYQSGLFVWKRAIREDIDLDYRNYYIRENGYNFNENHNFIDFRDIIESLSEYFMFFKNYYEKINLDLDEEIFIKILLTKSENRHLTPRRIYHVQGLSSENIIEFEGNFKIRDLKENYLEIARKSFIQNFFRIFNSGIPEEVTKKWQIDLFTMYI